MDRCTECYSEQPRVTPLLGARECLETHEQYICGTCGRCICIACDTRHGLQRWNFPFRSLAIARLYLRAAEATCKSSCGIYQITSKSGRSSFKIFCFNDDLKAYLNKNKDKQCVGMHSVYVSAGYREFTGTQIRKLSDREVEKYLLEQGAD